MSAFCAHQSFDIAACAPRYRRFATHKLVCEAKPPSKTPALDSLSPSIKLNSLIDTMARKNDRASALSLLNELQDTGEALERPALISLVNSFVGAPDELEHVLQTVYPDGYSSRSALSLPINMSQVSSASSSISDTDIDPDKTVDMSMATAFVGVVGSAISVEVVEPVVWHHSADEATTVLVLLILGLAYDRYAGSSSLWRRVQRGFIRLFRDDPIRTAQVDSACFLAAYVLGLPWMFFKPDGARVAKWIAKKEATARRQGQASLDLTDLIEKCVVWLVVGVSVEQDLDGMLIESDLSFARDLLRKRKRKRQELNKALSVGLERAKFLLQEYEDLHRALSDKMLHGATVGECLAMMVDHHRLKAKPR